MARANLPTLDRLHSLLEHIGRNFADATLTATSLASALHVSRAYLYRAFSEFGSSPASALREMRDRQLRELVDHYVLHLNRRPTKGELQQMAGQVGMSSARALSHRAWHQ